MFTMAPLRATTWGSSYFMLRNTPMALMSITESQVASL
jgi:hypothetical protein